MRGLPTLLRLVTSRSALTRTMATNAVDTLIFDVDDTLYPVSSGFSKHRNGPIVAKFMCEYWAAHCDFDAYLPRNNEFREQLGELRELGYKLVVFSNAPRKYARRCLDSLGLREFFRDEFIFGVEDVMPACKPEAAAFQTVLDAVGASPDSSIMFEDSLKNIRACRALGMRCVFIEEEVGGEAALLGDAAKKGDADLYEVKIRRIADLKGAAPWLWEKKCKV